jgi:hypothetical protein
MRLVAVAAGWLASSLLSAQPAQALRPLRTGFLDDVYLDPSAAVRATWLDRSRLAGAGIVRLEVRWAGIAPQVRPAGFRPANPSDPAYRWSGLDASVRDATARGLRVLITIETAPRWAEGQGAGSLAGTGTWWPDARELAAFMRAAAIRYSGSYVAPGSGALPRVRYWQVWNEPNLSSHLAPQGGKGGTPVSSPAIYRRMLNAAYTSLKAVRADNLVVMAGTAPYGDRTGRRTPPVRFLRRLLCLRGRGLRRGRCSNPARFDVFAHHPYSIEGPRHRAFGAEDAAIPDLPKLTRIVRAAVRKGTAFPRRRKRLWITEISWDSKPPDPDGVPLRTQARWLEESFYLLWRQGADTITWLQVRDDPSRDDFGSSVQSGVYFRGGQRKPAFTAFRFPFVSRRNGNGRVLVWGRAPRAGHVGIERRSGRRWTLLARLRTGRSNLFKARVRLRGHARLRARIGTDTSLSRRQR